MATYVPPLIQPTTQIIPESSSYYGSVFNSYSGVSAGTTSKYLTSVFLDQLNWIFFPAYNGENHIVIDARSNEIIKSIPSGIAVTNRCGSALYVPNKNQIYISPMASTYDYFSIYDVVTDTITPQAIAHPSTGLTNKCVEMFLLQGRYILAMWYGSSASYNVLIDTNDNSITQLTGLGTQVGYGKSIRVGNIIYSFCSWTGTGTAIKRYDVSNPLAISLVSGTPTTTMNNARPFYNAKGGFIYIFKAQTATTTFYKYLVSSNVLSGATSYASGTTDNIQNIYQDSTNNLLFHMVQGGNPCGLVLNSSTNAIDRTYNILNPTQANAFSSAGGFAQINWINGKAYLAPYNSFGDNTISIAPYLLTLPYIDIINRFNPAYISSLPLDSLYLRQAGDSMGGSLNIGGNANVTGTVSINQPITKAFSNIGTDFSKLGGYFNNTNPYYAVGTSTGWTYFATNVFKGIYIHYVNVSFTCVTAGAITLIEVGVTSNTGTFTLPTGSTVSRNKSMTFAIGDRFATSCVYTESIATTSNRFGRFNFIATSGTYDISITYTIVKIA